MSRLQTIIEYGFYIFIFFLPWQTQLIWRDSFLNGFVWEYGRLSLQATEIFLWGLLLLYGVWLVKTKHLSQLNFNQVLTRLKKPDVLIYWLVILFLLVAGASIFWSLNSDLAYYRWIRLIEGVTLFSAIVIFKFDLTKTALVWVASSVVQGVFAIGQFLAQYTFANKWLGLAEHISTVGGSIILQTDSERWLRAYGSLPHPNMLAGFLVVGLLFLLYLGFRAETRTQRFFILGSLVVITPALFFSFSRSAWIALIVSLVILSLWLFRHKHQLWNKIFFKLLIIIVLLVAILGINLSGPLLARILGNQALELQSIELRFAFTEQALTLIKNHSLLGLGIGNYTLGVFEEINNSWPGYYYQPVHNIYLLILAELGILGLVLFILILALLIWRLAKIVPSLEKTIVFLALLSVLVISVFDHYFWTLYFGVMMFWIILGLNLKQIATK